MPGSFPVPPPSRGKDPGNEVGFIATHSLIGRHLGFLRRALPGTRGRDILSTTARPAPPHRVLSKMAATKANARFKTPTPTGRLGETRKAYILPEKWRAWVRVCRLIMAAIVVSRVYSFSFVDMMFSDYQLLLTRR